MARLSKIQQDPKLQRDILNTQINRQIYDAQRQTPKSGDVAADTFTTMANTFEGADAKGWGGMAKAFLTGAAGGAKQKSILDRKEDLEKYQKVMEYLSAVNQETNVLNGEQDKINQAKISMQPKVAGFLQDLSQMSVPEIELGQRKLLDEYNQLAGTDFKSAGYIGGSPQVALIVNDQDQTERVDLPSFFEIPGFEENLKLAMPNVRAQAEQKQGNELARRALQEQQNALAEKNLTQRAEFHTPQHIMDTTSAKTAAQVQQKEIPKLDATIEKSDATLNNIDAIDKMIDGNEDIFQSQLMNLWMKEEPTALGNAIRKAGMTLSPEKSTAITKLNKFINEMVIDKAALFSRPNMFVEKIGSKAVPNWMMTPEGFKDVLAHIKTEIQSTRDNALQRRNQYAGNLNLNAWGNAPQGKSVTHAAIKVRDPETGEEMKLSPEEAQIAIDRGGIPV